MIIQTCLLIASLSTALLLSACNTTTNHLQERLTKKPASLEGLSVATFAGGCFWCMESNFEGIKGVKEVISGYSGGDTPNPSYKQSKSGKTGHTESVQIYYNPEQINYEQLLYWYWRSINPTDNQGQFVDRGKQYRPAIFYATEAEHQQALKSKQALATSKLYQNPINTEITAFKKFYHASNIHQDYYLTHPTKYRFYRAGSGRDHYLKGIWKQDFWKH